MGPISCSGLDLVKMGAESNPADEMLGDLGGMGSMGDMDSENEGSSGGAGGDTPPTWQLFILALIPIAGLVSAIAHKKSIYIASGAVPTLIFALYLVNMGGGLFKGMGVGAYLCIIAGIAMLCTASQAESAAMATEDGGGDMDHGGDSDGEGDGT